jgi:hypothetical protein
VQRAARRVHVHVDVLLGVFGLEVEQLRHHQVGHVVVDGLADEHDPLAQQPRVDVEGALPPGGLLEHHGDQRGGGASELHGALA